MFGFIFSYCCSASKSRKKYLLLKLGSRVGKSVPRTSGVGLALFWFFSRKVSRSAGQSFRTVLCGQHKEFQELLKTGSLKDGIQNVQKSTDPPLFVCWFLGDSYTLFFKITWLALPSREEDLEGETAGVAFEKSEEVG